MRYSLLADAACIMLLFAEEAFRRFDVYRQID